MRLSWAFVLASAMCTAVWSHAQAPPRDAASAPETGTAVVRGRVTDAETGAPLSRVVLSLTLRSTRTMFETTSDAGGAFEFTRLPAGEYTLSADPTMRRTSHRPGAYGVMPGQAGGKGGLIPLREGELFDKADIALGRSYAIAGRVFDDEGEPVSDARVEAEVMDPRTGGSATRSRSTDDRGAFRLWGYSPGAYRVCAAPLSVGPDQRSREGFIRTCYPSVPESEAQPVVITNADPPEVEIRLRRSRLVRVSGMVIDASGAPAVTAAVTFVTLDVNGTSMTGRSMQNDGGAFSYQGVAPGEYFVRAEIGSPYNTDDKTRELGYTAVSVQSADVENVVVATERPATVSGRLIFEGGAPLEVQNLTIRAEPTREALALRSGPPPPPVRVKPDLTFVLQGLFGPQTIQVEGARGWVIKSMRYRGEERAGIPTHFRITPDRAAVDIVMTNRTATLSGRVVDDRGQAAPDARVVLIPADIRQWDALSAPQSALARDGQFELAGVRPADYFVVVVPGGMGFSRLNRRVLEDLVKEAERVTLLENDQRTIDLRM